MITARSYRVTTAPVPGDKVVLAKLTMGDLAAHASTLVFTGMAAAAGRRHLDASVIFAAGARFADFSGYYLCGPDNPAYTGQSVYEGKPAVEFVTWDPTREAFVPPASGDWRHWPWQPGVDPCVLLLHSDGKAFALVIDDHEEFFAPQVVGAWARLASELRLGARPLVDPLLVMGCAAAQGAQTVADEVGRLVMGPTGDVAIGASPVSLDDESAGVRVGVMLYRTEDGRDGRFGSAYPQGPAGDRVRWAYRERFAGGDISWIAEHLAAAGTPVPQSARPRVAGSAGRVFGWFYFDERDWRSRQAALLSADMSPSWVTWAPNGAYRPGTPGTPDPHTGEIAPGAQPWRVREQGTLPFSVGEVVVVGGYFARGQFVVPDPQDNRSYPESPHEFSLRLRRDYQAAKLAERIRGRELPRTVLLLTDYEAVPPPVVLLLVQTLPDVEVITVSVPATMFLDSQQGTGAAQAKVALLPGSTAVGTPQWTRTNSSGTSELTLSPATAVLTPPVSRSDSLVPLRMRPIRYLNPAQASSGQALSTAGETAAQDQRRALVTEDDLAGPQADASGVPPGRRESEKEDPEAKTRFGRVPPGRRESENEDPEATQTRFKDTAEVLFQNLTPATAATVGERFTDPGASTPASHEGGIYGPFGAGLAAGFALWLNYKSIRAIKRDETVQQAGTIRAREGTRELNINLGEAAQNTFSMLGNIVNGVGGSLNFAAYAAPVFNAAFSAGGFLTLPAGVVQAARFGRKAAKARARVQALRALMAGGDQDPLQALAAANQEVEAHRDLVHALEELAPRLEQAIDTKNAAFDARVRELIDQSPEEQSQERQQLITDSMTLLWETESLRQELRDANSELRNARAGLERAKQSAVQRRKFRTDMDEMLAAITKEIRRPGRSEFVTLRMIQEYAAKKNNRGFIKKIIIAMSGAFASAGATATLVATIAICAGAAAGAGVLVATPVGWGLVAAATASWLGVASYKGAKYLAKRWRWLASHDAGGQRSTLKRLDLLLAVWKKVGPSKREEYAAALYRMANSQNTILTSEARKTIAALGMDWDSLNMGDNPESATKLIAAKMASSATLPPA
jgi:hypothetical protein